MASPKPLYKLTALLLIAGVAGVLYIRETYTLAKISDHVGLVMASHLRDSVPGLAIRMEPTQKIVDATAVTATGTGSLGACSYFLLRKCVAISLDEKVNDQPRLLNTVIEVLSDVCKSVRMKEDLQAQILSSYFRCGEQPRARVRVHVNIVSGLASPAYKIPLPDGGVTYGRPERSLLSQTVLVNGN